MYVVPASARVACWLNAWLGGRESADAVITGLTEGQPHMGFSNFGASRSLSAAFLLGELRQQGVHRVSAALPAPGDLVGLGGPSTFNTEALDVGEAVLLHGPDVGFIPSRVGPSTQWVGATAAPPTYLPDIATADQELRLALVDAARDLAELDVASWNPEVADALMNLRAPTELDAPMAFVSPSAARTALAGLRSQRIVELAFRDDGGTVSSSQAAMRRTALTPLARASRAAVVAACSSVDGR
ncbi:MAG: hypothetical protein H0U28_09530 [Nocardioidaceae bacterium]|nr:hypothetical protein [Nocardioidaceae bacterium]